MAKRIFNILIVFCIAAVNLFAQSGINVGTPNLSFEQGNFNNWTRELGSFRVLESDYSSYEYYDWTTVTNSGQRIELQSSMNTNDPVFSCSNFYTNPTGYSAARVGRPMYSEGMPIGGYTCTQRWNNYRGAAAERLTYTFTVTKQTTLLYFQFAMVLHNPGTATGQHFGQQYPTFGINITITDPVSGLVSKPQCTSIELHPSDDPANEKYLKRYTSQCNNSIAGSDLINFQYLPWTIGAVNLIDFIGQTVTIEIYNHDCLVVCNGYPVAGGHSAYGYFTAETRSLGFNIRNCEGEDAVITAPSGFSKYTWSRSDGLPITYQTAGDSSAIVVDQSTLNPSTLYTCSLATGTDCGEIVLDTTLNTIAVRPDFEYTIDCGGEVHFTNTSLCAQDSIIAYKWLFGDGDYSEEKDPSHIYSTPGSHTIQLTAFSQSGCSKTITETIIVPQYPVPDISGENNVCSGTEISLFADGGTYGCVYEWRKGNKTSPVIGNEQALVDTATISQSYYVTVTDPNNCVYEDDIYVLVRTSPNVLITGDNEVCIGDSASLTARNAQTYQWEGFGTNASIRVKPEDNPTTYKVIGYSSNGCFAEASFPVAVRQLPVVSVSGNPEI